MLFQNSPIELSELPQSESIPFEQLAPAYPKVAHIRNLLFFSILGLGIGIVFYVKDLPNQSPLFWLIPCLAFLWAILSTLLVNLAYEIQGYALREKDILHRRGVIFRKTTVIPFNRVQHCEVKQGPVERLFNLRTLEVYTAGGQSSDLRIPGLLGERAIQLKEFILKRTAAHEPR